MLGTVTICEFADGRWGYPNEQLIKDKSEVSFLPDVHRIRCEAWLKNRSKSSKKQKDADKTLMAMDESALRSMLPDEDTEGMAKDELIAKIQKREVDGK